MRLLTIIAAIVAVLALSVTPQFLSTYYTGLMVQMLIFAIFAMSLDILLGYSGLPSLGHAAYFGVGGYMAGYLALKVTKNFWIDTVAGLAIALAIAAIYGVLALRARGVYFLMITLALSQLLWGIAMKWTSVTKGDNGLAGIPRPDLIFLPFDLTGVNNYYYLTLVVFLVAAALIYLAMNSPFGYALRGIRESESRMEAMGYNVWLYKYVAFVLAGFFAGLAGVLFAYYNGMVHPVDLSIVSSSKVLLMVILGGAGSFVGPIVGAFAIVLLENFVSGFTERWIMVMGAIYVLVIMLAPRGVYNPIHERLRKWLRPS